MTKYVLSTWNLIYFGFAGPITVSANNDHVVIMGLIIGFITVVLDIAYLFSTNKESKI